MYHRLNTLKLHFCGPSDYRLEQSLPLGTDTYRGVLSPSGHLLLPCGEFHGPDSTEDGRLDVGPDLALQVVDKRDHSSSIIDGGGVNNINSNSSISSDRN